MASKHPLPEPAPLPSEGGTYFLNPATGQWVKQPEGNAPPATAPQTDPVTLETDGFNSEAPAAGED